MAHSNANKRKFLVFYFSSGERLHWVPWLWNLKQLFQPNYWAFKTENRWAYLKRQPRHWCSFPRDIWGRSQKVLNYLVDPAVPRRRPPQAADDDHKPWHLSRQRRWNGREAALFRSQHPANNHQRVLQRQEPRDRFHKPEVLELLRSASRIQQTNKKVYIWIK